MTMNLIIQEKRRALGLTQEQVAEHMGVSTPAVSKWETGQTCPDTALLPRLARLLKTDLNSLFAFQESLSSEEIREICTSIRETGQKDGAPAAFALAEDQLRSFPHCEELLLNTAFSLEAVTNLSPADTAAYGDKVDALFEKLAESSDLSIRNSANFMLANKYIRRGELEQAQQVLDRMPDKQDITQELADKMMLQVTIYQQQGKYEEAAEKLEYAMLTTATRMKTLLSQYAGLEMTAGNPDRAKAAAEKGAAFGELFQLWEYTCYVDEYMVALKAKDAGTVLSLLRKLLTALTQPWNTADTVLFRHVQWNISPDQYKDIRAQLLASLERDAEFEFLRETPEFDTLLKDFRI